MTLTLPTRAEIEAAAATLFPRDERRRLDTAYGLLCAYYDAARSVALEHLDPPEDEDEEDETHDIGEPVGVRRALPVDPEAVDLGAMPTVEERIMSTPTGRMRA